MSEQRNPAIDIVGSFEAIDAQRRRLTLIAIVVIAVLTGLSVGYGLKSIGGAEKEVQREAAELADAHAYADRLLDVLNYYQADLPAEAKLLRRAIVERHEGDLGLPIEFAEEVLRTDPLNPIALAVIGEVKVTSDQPEEAIAALERAVEIRRAQAMIREARVTLGDSPQDVGTTGSRASEIAAGPEFNLGLAYHSRAKRCRLERVAAAVEDRALPRCDAEGDEALAAATLDQAVAKNHALIDLAVADGLRDVIEGEIGSERVRAIRLENMINRRIALSLQAVRAGDVHEAVRLYREVLDVAPEDGPVYARIEGWLTYHYRKLAKINPEDREARDWLEAHPPTVAARMPD